MTKKFIIGIPNKHNIPMKRSQEIIIKKTMCQKEQPALRRPWRTSGLACLCEQKIPMKWIPLQTSSQFEMIFSDLRLMGVFVDRIG